MPPVTRESFWVEKLRALSPRTVLEVGVWRGGFAAALLNGVSSIETYYMIDPWRRLDRWNKPFNTSDDDLQHAYETAMQAVSFAAGKVKVLRGTTIETIDSIADASLDFAYIDGDHTLRGITIDLVCVYPKIAPGGSIGGDDFRHDIWHHGPRYEPTLVFPFAPYFAEAVGAEFSAPGFDQFALRKPNAGVVRAHPSRALPEAGLRELICPPKPSSAARMARWLRNAAFGRH